MPETNPGQEARKDQFTHRIPVLLVRDIPAFIDACDKIYGSWRQQNYTLTLNKDGHHEVVCSLESPVFLLRKLQEMGVAEPGDCPDSKGWLEPIRRNPRGDPL